MTCLPSQSYESSVLQYTIPRIKETKGVGTTLVHTGVTLKIHKSNSLVLEKPVLGGGVAS